MVNDVITWRKCHAWHIAENIFAMVLNFTVEIVLMMRREPSRISSTVLAFLTTFLYSPVYALYHKNRFIRNTMVVLFVAGEVLILGVTAFAGIVTARGKLLSPPPGSNGLMPDPDSVAHCVIAAPTSIFVICW